MAIYSFPIEIKNHDLNLPTTEFEKITIRKLSEIKKVLSNPSNLDFNCSVYKSFRGVKKKEDKSIFEKNNIRHDLTIIPPGVLNGEFVKTYGHYHPKIKTKKLTKSYPEIYQVIKGLALFIIQNGPENLNQVKFIFASKKNIVIIPPDFGHTTINFSQNDLVLANLVADTFQANYKIFENKKGASFYILENHPLIWYPNPNYKNLPEPIFCYPKLIFKKQYLYEIFKENPTKFNWLLEPNQFPFKEKDLFEKNSWHKIKMDLEI